MGTYPLHNHSTNVVIVEATAMACELLANALRRASSFQVVGWELHSAAALAKISHAKPDIALISSSLQDGPGKGLTVVSELHRTQAKTRSIVLVDTPDRQSTLEAFRAGARGIVGRGAELTSLPKCVRRVHEGQIWASTQELNYLLESFAAASQRTLSETCRNLLTAREREITQLAADGLSNREIAGQLQLSRHTVKNYLFTAFEKIGVSSRVELALSALCAPYSEAALKDDVLHDVNVGVRRRRDAMTNC